MPYRTFNVSTRTLLQLTAISIFMFFVGGVGAALAGSTVTSADGVTYNAAVPPVVIPYTVVPVAGNNHSATAGYGGDTQLAQGPTYSYPVGAPISYLSAPGAVAVDTAGNVYISDYGNGIIREVNAQTGIINTIAGTDPSGCTAGVCSTKPAVGCSNGVTALGAGIGGTISGLAVDGYGNVYYIDNKTETVSVIYRGGSRVASFIKAVNPAGVTNSGGSVVPGDVYYIAGAINLTTCVATTSTTKDNVLPFADMSVATAANGELKYSTTVSQLYLDSAGNIYISSPGSIVVLVINTQTTAQNFFGYTVPSGYIKALFPCTSSSLTNSTCSAKASTFGAPASQGTYSPLNVFGADAWGNVYVANGSGALPGNAAAVSYAGGPLGHLINTELQTGGGQTNTLTATASVTPAYADFYEVIDGYSTAHPSLSKIINFVAANAATQPEIRPNSIISDALGNLWYSDNHYPTMSRVDVNSQTVTAIIGSSNQRTKSTSYGTGYTGITPTTTTVTANLVYCDYGASKNSFASGPTTYDVYGDNCPAALAAIGLSQQLAVDGMGDIIFSDNGTPSSGLATQLVRELLLDTVFPVTAISGYTPGYPSASATGYTNTTVPVVASPVTQAIQIHFDQWNKPYTTSAAKNATGTYDFTTTAFSIAPELSVAVSSSTPQIPDFTIDTADAEFTAWSLYGDDSGFNVQYTNSTGFLQEGAPTCNQPSALLSRVVSGASTPPSDPDFGIDCVVYVTFNPQAPGLRRAQLVVTTEQMQPNSNVSTLPNEAHVFNTYYIPLYGTGYGAQLAIDGAQQAVVPTTGFTAGTSTGPNAVAVSTTGVVYATDPAGSRIIVSPPAQPVYPFDGETTSGSTSVILTTTSGLAVGLPVTGVGIPLGATIQSIGTVAANTSGQITLSAAATATSAGYIPLYITFPGTSYTGTTAIGSTTIAISSSSLGLAVGQTVTGTGIPANTTITSVGVNPLGVGAAGSITLSNAATATASSVPLTVAIGPSLSLSSVTGYVPYTTTSTAATLSGPLGVAIDAANNIYISDTGNNSILKVNPITSVATQLGNYVWVSGNSTTGSTTTDPLQYTFKAPQGLAVDTQGNVYVADTGNGVVAEIPSNPGLGGAFALLQGTGFSSAFTTPVAVAVDQRGNVYVVDSASNNGKVVVIPAGGGDLVGGQFAGNVNNEISLTSPVTLSSSTPLTSLGGTGISKANGIAVDAAGNVYISDSSNGAVWVTPVSAATPTLNNPYILNLAGTSSPAGIALDQNGNVYVADSGLGQILYLNRQNPTASFGIVPEGLAAASGLAGIGVAPGSTSITTQCPVLGSATPCLTSNELTITNIGNAPYTIPASFSTLTGSNDFGIASSSCAAGTLLPGATCNIAPTFFPSTVGAQTASLTIGSQTVSLSGATESGTGEPPLVNIVLTSSTGTTPAANLPTSIIATVTQPHTAYVPNGYVPSGWVDFTWGINGTTATSTTAGLCGINGGDGKTANGATYGDSGKIALNSSGVATYPLPNTAGLSAGLKYTITAKYYPGDANSSQTNAPTPLSINVAYSPVESVTAPSLTFSYGSVPPTLSGTGFSVSPDLTSGNSVVFTAPDTSIKNSPTLAQCADNVGTYNIVPVFTGPSACGYGSPTAYNSNSTTQATVTETPIPLTVSFSPNTMSSYFGATNINFSNLNIVTYTTTATSTGVLPCGDTSKLSSSFSLASSPGTFDTSLLHAISTPYQVVPTAKGPPITAEDYSPITANDLTLKVLQAPTSVSVTAAQPSSVLAANLSSATYAANVSTSVSPGGSGTPSGNILVSDTFTPIIATTPGTGTTIPACSVFFAGTTTSGSATVSSLSSTFGLVAGETITAIVSGSSTNPIPANTTLSALASGSFTLSANATATVSGVTLQATVASGTTCNPTNTVALLSGGATYTPASPTFGIHNYGFVYLGDNDFAPVATSASGVTTSSGGNCTTQACLTVDNADFVITTTSGVVTISPGVTAGYGILAPAVGQTSAYPETAYISITSILSQTGVVNLSCATLNPKYVYCAMTPAYVTLTGSGSQTSVLSVWTPATLPLGFFNTSHVRTSATRTAWAFLPLGVLAFCVRRRRKLSKALWMLIAVAAVSAGMSGCGGNQVALYTPVPTGAQTVTVTGSGTSITDQSSIVRSLVVNININ